MLFKKVIPIASVGMGKVLMGQYSAKMLVAVVPVKTA
jgi:hypothetical protein